MNEIIVNKLLSLQDLEYQAFSNKLIKTKYPIIGIRIPALRQLAKELLKEYDLAILLDMIGSKYHEEHFLYGMLVNYFTDEKYFVYFKKFLPRIDNWATCDICCTKNKFISKNKDEHFAYFYNLALHKKEFYARAGLDMMMGLYVDNNHINEILSLCCKINNHNYYVKMALAWLLCECYIKQPKLTKAYLLDNQLDKFTFNKTISKICDSYRVSQEEKDWLKKLRKK